MLVLKMLSEVHSANLQDIRDVIGDMVRAVEPAFCESGAPVAIFYEKTELGGEVLAVLSFGEWKLKFRDLTCNLEHFEKSGRLLRVFGKWLIPQKWRQAGLKKFH